MRNFIHISILVLFAYTGISAQHYANYFNEKACRVDFQLSGNAKNTTATISKLSQEQFWGGRRMHLSNYMNLGDFRFQIVDSASNTLIYTDGFSTLFHEWQSTPEALIINKSFEQSIQFPYPLHVVKVIIEKRLDFDKWEELIQFKISPDDKLIRKRKPLDIPVKMISKTALPEKALDIAVIAEGYTAKQRSKFYRDAQKLAQSILSHEPFTKYKSRINVYAIAAASVDSGVTIPQNGDWRNTALGAHYFTFYSERYLTTPNAFTVFDYASLVPYDAIYILANTKTYGGGGIYNLYSMASADSKRAQSEVTVHEFGHSFAGLGDEYFYDTDVLDNLYKLDKEPWEPNISTLVNFAAKWKNDLPENTIIPTPVIDSNKKRIGVFEGAGYLKKGIYRPYFDCRMRTNAAKHFCPVCEKAVEKRILFLTE